MSVVTQGIVQGNSIQLTQPLPVPDGQRVEIEVRAVSAGRARGEGLLRTEGALADDDEWDAIMDEIHRARRWERRTSSAELGSA